MLTRILVWNVHRKKKNQRGVSIAYVAKVAFNGTQYRAVLNYYRDPHQWMQKDRESRGSDCTSRQSWWCSERSEYSKRGVKNWSKCLPQKAVMSTLGSLPLFISPHPQLFPHLKALRSLRVTGGHEADERGSKGSRFLFDWTLQHNKRERAVNTGEGEGESAIYSRNRKTGGK